MDNRFPHISDTSFPDVAGVDVYKYRNELDYTRYNYSQMKITVCSVPWDMGEAHVGNRTISGIGNVVYFESKENRDRWFEDIPDSECFRFETKYKELHRDNEIVLPLPFDIAAKYNYVMVEYSLFANDDSPLQYEDGSGIRKWFWFIREVEFAAPNATKVHLLPDSWQQWVYDFEISGVMLERGHYPLFRMGATEYLQNPIANCDMLLAPDIDVNDPVVSQYENAVIFNDEDTICIFATTGNMTYRQDTVSWGTKENSNWQCPGNPTNLENGYPSPYLFAIETRNLSAFMMMVHDTIPQFVQTVQAIFFIRADLVTLGNAIRFYSMDIYPLECVSADYNLHTFRKEDFHYPTKYAELAKLYTYPYAAFEIANSNGAITRYRIENTGGRLQVHASLNGLFPQIALNAHINGINGTQSGSYDFFSVTRNNFPFSGKWLDTVFQLDVPTFGMVQSFGTRNDYADFFARRQQALENATNQTNAQALADAAYNNAVMNADTQVSNAGLQVDYNNSAANNSNTQTDTMSDNAIVYNNDTRDVSNFTINNTSISEVDVAEAQAAISSAASAASGVASAVGSLATGNIAGAVGALVGGGISAASTMAQATVSNNLTVSLAQYNMYQNTRVNIAANNKSITDAAAGINLQNAMKTASNSLTNGTAANTSSAIKQNAARDLSAASGNASRTRSTADSGINNMMAQANLQAPLMYGNAANIGTAASRPFGLFINLVTQPISEVSRIGDEFLRYGYRLDKAIDFRSWNIGKYFTYWKLRDFWIKNLNIPDMYVDRLRFFLFGGVTVWRNPEDIGHVSIYENYPDS